MNVPKLRFPEFHGEWSKKTLKEISSEITYGMNSASKTFDGINKYIRITDIDDESSRFKTDNLVSPSNKLDNNFLVKENDILFARTGASTGKTYLYNSEDGKLYYAGFLIKANIIKHNAYFIFQQTKLEKYKKWVKLTSVRSGQPGINSKEYGKYSFSTTVLREENKIGLFFSLLDKKIELQSKKVEALKLFKKGLLNKLINDSNGYPIKLEKIFNIFAGGTPSTSNHDYWNGNIKWIQSGLIQNNIINDNMIKTSISIEGLKHSSAKLIKPNTTLLAMTGATCGNTAFLTCSATANQSVMAFESSKCNNKYLYYLFQNNKNYILKFQAGGAQSGINKNSCKNMIFSFPPLEDQNKIVNVLDAYENMIILRIKQLNMLKELKKD